MNLEAKYSREWRDRMGIILLMLVGSSGWFFYDGCVAYPKYNEGAAAYAQIVSMVKEEGITDETDIKAEAAKRWEKAAAQFDGDPKEPPEHAKNIATQLQFGIGLAIFALAFLAWVWREMRRVIRSNDETFDGLTTAIPPFNGKTSVRYDSVYGIDKRKWKNKGIAVVYYKNQYGRPRRAIIDDYKYAGTEAILEKCEAVIAAKKAQSNHE